MKIEICRLMNEFFKIGLVLIFLIGYKAQGNERLVTLNNLPEALQTAKKGDVFVVKKGNYSDIDIILRCNNAFEVTIKPETAGAVVISGRSSLLIKDSQNITFEGFYFKEVQSKNVLMISKSNNISIKDNFFYKCGNTRFGIILGFKEGSSYNSVFCNTFEENQAMGVVIVTSPSMPLNKKNIGNKIFKNRFFNVKSVKSVYPESEGNGMECIQLGQGLEDSHTWRLQTHVFENVFEQIIGDGDEIISVKTSGNLIYNNNFLNNKSGLTLRLGDNSVIQYNLFENTTRGIRVYGYGHVITSNYFKDPDYGIQLPSSNLRRNDNHIVSAYYQQEDCEISDNIIINAQQDAISIGKGRHNFYANGVKLFRNTIIANNGNDIKFWGDAKASSILLKNNRIYSERQTETKGRAPYNKRQVEYLAPVVGSRQIDLGVERSFGKKEEEAGASWVKHRNSGL